MNILCDFSKDDEVALTIIKNSGDIEIYTNRAKPLSYYLDIIEKYKIEAKCWLSKEAYLKNIKGIRIIDRFIEHGFRVN